MKEDHRELLRRISSASIRLDGAYDRLSKKVGVKANLLWLLYALSQDRRQPLRNLAPGIVVSLAVWMVLSMCYSFYVENFASYSVIYSSIGTVIVLLIWLYMSATTLVMGAEFNGMLISLRVDRKSEELA